MKKYLLQNIVCILGIVIGILAIYRGMYFEFRCWNNSLPSGTTFGADFYTEIYSVTEDIEDNFHTIYNLVSEALGTLIAVLGSIDICVFGCLLTKNLCLVKKRQSKN